MQAPSFQDALEPTPPSTQCTTAELGPSYAANISFSLQIFPQSKTILLGPPFFSSPGLFNHPARELTPCNGVEAVNVSINSPTLIIL